MSTTEPMLAQISQVDADGKGAARGGLLARLTRWAERRRYASLAFCLTLFATQIAGAVLLFMVTHGAEGPWIVPVEFMMRAVLLLLPLGSILGIYLATRTPAGDQGHPLQVFGILANGAYLLYGLYIGSIMLGNLFT